MANYWRWYWYIPPKNLASGYADDTTDPPSEAMPALPPSPSDSSTPGPTPILHVGHIQEQPPGMSLCWRLCFTKFFDMTMIRLPSLSVSAKGIP